MREEVSSGREGGRREGGAWLIGDMKRQAMGGGERGLKE